MSSKPNENITISGDTPEELWYVLNIANIKYRREFIECCVKQNYFAKVNLRLNCCGIDVLGVIIDVLGIDDPIQKEDNICHTSSGNGVVKICGCFKTKVLLTELDISNNNITNKMIEWIAEVLKINTLLQKLNISCNKLTDDGAFSISDSLNYNQTLKELNIARNWITKEGLLRIAVACTKNRTLHKLVCTHNNLSISGLQKVTNYIRMRNAIKVFKGSWNSVNVRNNCLAIKTVFHLLDLSIEDRRNANVSDNTHKELWCVGEINDKTYRKKFVECCVKENKCVQVHIPSHSYGIDVVNIISKVLTNNSNQILHTLNIVCWSKYVNDQALIVTLCKCLQANSTLLSLYLSGNDIAVKCIAEALQMNTTLKRLCLTCKKVSNDGAVAIGHCFKKNTTLREFIMSNDLTDEKIKIITEALYVNMTLRNIDISRNKISNSGTVDISNFLKHNKTLQELNISKNWISKEGVMRIVVACTKNRTLHKLVCTHNNLSKSGLAVINNCIRKTNAVNIFVGSWNNISSKNDQLSIMTTLNLLDMSCEAGKIESLHACKELWCVNKITKMKYRIEFVRCCVTDNDCVQVLMPKHCCGVNLRRIILETNKTLESLRILKVEASRICQYLEINTTLTELSISNNNFSRKSDQIFYALKLNKVLQKLNISCNNITDVGAIAIMDWLERNTALVELNLSCNHVGSRGINLIAEALKMNTVLKKLDISCNKISDSGSEAISDSLRVNNTLKNLNVSSNSITDQGIYWLAEALKVNKAMQKIDISKNKMSDFGMMAISDSLKTNVTLFGLKFSGDGITNEGLKYFAEALQINRMLQKLAWHWKMSDVGVVAISNCLKTSATLVKLDISGNYIGDCGTMTISKVLQINITLQTLNISNNQLSNYGAVIISEYLENNKTLHELNISKNWIDIFGVMRIVIACAKNRTLHKLVCTHNNLSKRGLTEIDEYIRKENAVKIFEGSWNSIYISLATTIKTTFHCFDMYSEVVKKEDNLTEELWDLQKIPDLKSRRKFVKCCIEENECVQGCIPKLTGELDWFEIFVHALRVNGGLQSLDLSLDKIPNDKVPAFSTCLETNKTLMELNIAYNNFTEKSIKLIAKALEINKTLQILNLAGNKLNNEGAIAISRGLAANTTLIELNLSNTFVLDICIEEILTMNTTLQKLDISSNGLSSIVSTCLLRNTTLKELILSDNNITDVTAMQITKALLINRTLRFFEMTKNKISDSVALAITE